MLEELVSPYRAFELPSYRPRLVLCLTAINVLTGAKICSAGRQNDKTSCLGNIEFCLDMIVVEGRRPGERLEICCREMCIQDCQSNGLVRHSLCISFVYSRKSRRTTTSKLSEALFLMFCGTSRLTNSSSSCSFVFFVPYPSFRDYNHYCRINTSSQYYNYFFMLLFKL